MTSSITRRSRRSSHGQRTRLHLLTILGLVTLLLGRASCDIDPLDCGYDEDNDGIVPTPGTPVCHDQDRQALLAFKASISSDPNHALADWHASLRNCCSWNGVTCNGATGRVVRVKLYNQNLKGTLSPQLSGLSSLQVLHLDNNDLSGSIPSSFGKLGKLQRLCLSVNPSLSGPIPESFGRLGSLQLMDLRSNSLSGPLPASFGNMSNLINLHLYGNKISGPIPPSFGLLSKLYSADLGNNQISGRIPDGFGNALSSLVFLLLGNNRITGLPADLRNLTSLQWLDLSSNPIVHGDALAGIATLPLIVQIELSSCQISGSFPEWVARLPHDPDMDLMSDEVTPSLNLANNAISGSIPAAVGKLTYLEYLRLENNKLTGCIPASFVQLQDLQGFNVSNNQLSGSIPQVEPFTTFDKLAYMPGNLGLCGLPLNPCQNKDLEHLSYYY